MVVPLIKIIQLYNDIIFIYIIIYWIKLNIVKTGKLILNSNKWSKQFAVFDRISYGGQYPCICISIRLYSYCFWVNTKKWLWDMFVVVSWFICNPIFRSHTWKIMGSDKIRYDLEFLNSVCIVKKWIREDLFNWNILKLICNEFMRIAKIMGDRSEYNWIIIME